MPVRTARDKLQGLRKHCTVNWRAFTPSFRCGVSFRVGLGQVPPKTLQGLARLEGWGFRLSASSKQELQLISASSSLSKMTSFPEFGEATTATEVADAFSQQIKGKNGTKTSLFCRKCRRRLKIAPSPARRRQSQLPR